MVMVIKATRFALCNLEPVLFDCIDCSDVVICCIKISTYIGINIGSMALSFRCVRMYN